MRKILASVIALLLFGATSMAQTTVQVAGRVLDSASAPLSGASIREKGAKNGVSAGNDGRFRMTVRQGATLVISAVGYASQEVAASSSVTVSLNRDVAAGNLNEVVVTALGIRRSSRSTGYATATVSQAELTQARATNVANGLTGKVAGLQVNTVNNGVGADVRIVLRGERSILGNNQALIVIDNVPVSASFLNSLNPDDIENVSILKGANAAALYGSDASNGVVMVTTKRGVRAKPNISFTHSTTIEKVSFFPKLNTRFGAGSTEPDSLSAYTGFYGRIPYENQMYGPEYDGRPVALGYAKRFYKADGTFDHDSTQTISYDYKNPTGNFFKTGRTIQNGISYSSGDQNGSLFFSGQFNNTTGTVPNDKANRYSLRVGATRTSGKFSSNFSVGYTRYETNTAGVDYNQGRPVYWNVLNTPGEVPIQNYKDLSQPFANENNWYNAYYPNPYWQIYNSRVMTNQDDILGSLELGLKATNWLTFTYRVGATARNYQQKNTQAGVTFTKYEISDPLGAGNTASGAPNGINPTEFDQLQQRFILQSDFLINMEHKFLNDDLGVRLLLGNSINKSNIRNLQTGNNQLEIPGLYNVSNLIGIPTVAESLTKQGRIGAFGSLQLSYKNFLFLEVTGRNDWDSRLAKQNRSFFYPGVNGSFVFTDAITALKDISWLSFGKLTASYTKVGSVSVNPYQLANTFDQINGFPYNTLTGFSLGNVLANPNLKPEFTNSKEVGLNFGLLRNRMNIGITYYNQIVTNQTVGIGISGAAGYTSALQNVGKVTNSGWEFEAKLTPLVNLGPVRFNINANLALTKSYVNQIDPNVTSITIGGFTSGAIYTIEKQPMRVLQVTDYLRDSLGRVIVSPTTGQPSIATGLTNVGRSTPNVILGINPSFEYKGLTLSVLGEYRGGYTVYNLIGNAMAFTGISAVTTATGRQRFVYPNSVVLQNGKYVPNTNIVVNNASNGSSFWTSATSFRGAGTNFITSGDFWKVREVNLSYAIPLKGSITRVIKRASLGLIARNLFTFLPKDNVYADPEYSSVTATGQGTSGNVQGISNENLSPPTRIFGATLNVTF